MAQQKKVVTFGEIMLRLTPPGFQRFSQASSFDVIYGGSESNVAVSLANYGVPTEFVTRLPQNEIGEAAMIELRKRGVGTQFIAYGGERLGIYFLEMGAVARGSKVVYDRSHSAMTSIEPGMIDWEEVFSEADWFHWSGITPAISQTAAEACKEAVFTARRMGLTVSTDLNYRKNLWKYGKTPDEVMPEMVEMCDIIFGDGIAAEEYFGIDILKGSKTEAEQSEALCKQLMERFPQAKKIIVTFRGAKSASHNTWSGALYNGREFIQSPTYEITHIVDRVGGGDSFMGGLIYGLRTYTDDEKALRFATAASCLKHTIYGDVNLVTVEEVEKLMSGDGSGRVSR